jgi:hypothetical protein
VFIVDCVLEFFFLCRYSDTWVINRSSVDRILYLAHTRRGGKTEFNGTKVYVLLGKGRNMEIVEE